MQIKSLEEVINRLQYKADNIKAKLEPSYFTECIDYLKSLNGDLISKSALIKALTNVEVSFYLEDGQTSDTYDGTTIMDIIEEQTTISVDDGWIPCSSGVMPMEHDSIFANYKGTGKWNDAMFEKVSNEVNITVVDEKGNRTTTHAHTIDGKWNCDLLKCNKTYKVIAWRELPPAYVKGE